jgi:hypothetical protein
VSRLVSWVVAAGLLLAAPGALAQGSGRSYSRGQGWSVLSGETVGHDNNVLVAQAGWPGVALGLLHGASPRFDIGGRFSFVYGEQRVVQHNDPGVKMQAWLRLALLEDARVNLGLTFAPGLFFSFRPDNALTGEDTLVGMEFPVGLVLGVPVGSALMLNFGMDVPFFVTFGEFGGPVVPVMFGGGFEYFLDRQLAFTFNVRMGPSIPAYDQILRADGRGRVVDVRHFHDPDRDFALDAAFGVAYRF